MFRIESHRGDAHPIRPTASFSEKHWFQHQTNDLRGLAEWGNVVSEDCIEEVGIFKQGVLVSSGLTSF